MIARDRLKLGIATVALAVAVALLLGGLAVLAGLHRAFLTGASPRDVFTPVPAVVGDLDPVVVWRPDPTLPREMEPATRVALTEAWTSAFGRVDQALVTASTHDLVTSFSGNALQQVTTGVEAADGLRRQVPVAHDLEVVFYSADGSIVELVDHGLELVRVLAHDETIVVEEHDETWAAVLLLRDGRWRVEQLVRRAGEPAATVTEAPRPLAMDGLGVNLLVGGSWTEPWSTFDATVAAAQLDEAVALGLGHVRVFLPYADLGGPAPGADELAAVERLLDEAAARDLGVTLTLFDGWTERGPEHWPDAVRHLEVVVPALAGHPALVTWDLKNEPDRDDATEGRSLNRAWLRHVGATVRELDSSTPVTIGWSTIDAADDLLDLVDVVSFHHYRPVDELEVALPRLLEAADGRPVVLQETGLPTWAGLLPGGHTEREQAAYVAAVRTVAADSGVAAVQLWTLQDPTEPPPDAGRSPWRRNAETSLGLLGADGSPKLVAQQLADGTDPRTVESVGLADRLTKPFWRLVLGSGAVLAVAVPLLARRRQRAT